MKKLISATAIALFATSAMAQVTTQTAVLGESGDPVYSVQIQGADGNVYNCKPDLATVDGQTVRVCKGKDSGGLFAAGAGLGGGAAVAGAVVLVAVAAAAGGGNDTVVTPNT